MLSNIKHQTFKKNLAENNVIYCNQHVTENSREGGRNNSKRSYIQFDPVAQSGARQPDASHYCILHSVEKCEVDIPMTHCRLDYIHPLRVSFAY